MLDPARMVQRLRRLNIVTLDALAKDTQQALGLIEDVAAMIEQLAAAVDVPGYNAGVEACIRLCRETYEHKRNGSQELSFDKRQLQLGEQYAYHSMAKYYLPALLIADAGVTAPERTSDATMP
jgi:hypothetical protein